MRPVHRRAVQSRGLAHLRRGRRLRRRPRIIIALSAGVPPAWQPEAPWHEAVPSDADLKGIGGIVSGPGPRPLVDQALRGNQNLRVAAARLEQAAAR